MHRWAASAAFPGTLWLCVCVDPDALGTAREFSQKYFKGAPQSLLNGFIDDRADFPNFSAQLGCQGFIIVGSGHKIVEPASPPWTQYRDQAFGAVEARLQKLLMPSNPAQAPIGQQVRIVGLMQAKELNGQCGEVVGSLENGRYQVRIDDETKALRPSNLEDSTGAPVGKSMRVVGLTSEKGSALNGTIVEVLGGTSAGRYIVRQNVTTFSLLPANLEDAPEDMDLDAAAAPKTCKSCADCAPEHGVPSVGIEAMDQQHADCAEALEALSSKLTVAALRHVQKEFAEHFKEEEDLMKQSGFGGAPPQGQPTPEGGDMSAYGSHSADHRRIVQIASDALKALQNVSETEEGAVPKEVACRLSKAFVEHATMYDSLYVGKLGVAAG